MPYKAVLKQIHPQRNFDPDEAVLRHLGLVKAIAYEIYGRLPASIEVEDLVNAGVVGLIDAAARFKPGKAVKFSSYAKYRIRGEIIDSVRRLDWIPRSIRQVQKRAEAATQGFWAKLGRPPTEAEVAKEIGMEVDQYRKVAVMGTSVGMSSASTRPRPRDLVDLPPLDFEADPSLRPDLICAIDELADALNVAAARLPERSRTVVDCYYQRQMTMTEIGEFMGISESRVCQIHKSALENMHASMAARGIHSAEAFAAR